MAKKATPVWEAFGQNGLERIEMTFSRKSMLLDLVKSYRIFRKLKPHAVGTHSNIDSKVALIAATAAGIKHRLRYRHVSIPIRSNVMNRWLYNSCATSIITTAKDISQRIVEGLNVPKGKTHVIPTGVDAPLEMESKDEARLRLCRELGVSLKTRFLGQISVLRRWKGQVDVMDAFDRIGYQFPDHHLVFVGGGPGLDYLPPEAEKRKYSQRIHFLGHKENPWPYFLALDLNVLASWEAEGIPQSGIQSMLAKTPFIGTRVGGIPEIVNHESNGILVEPRNPKDLSRAMLHLLSDKKYQQYLVANAYKYATKIASTAIMGEKVLRILKGSVSK